MKNTQTQEKAVWLAIIIIFVVVLMMYYFHRNRADIYTFTCPDGSEISISYSGKENANAKLKTPEGDYSLHRAVSGSGARYANEDESVVFWEHQGEARVEMGGEAKYESCTMGTEEPEEPAGTPITSAYQSPDLVGWTFSLKAPVEVQFSQANENTVEAKYIGPNAIPNSEITDGYYLSFHIADNTSIEDYLKSAEPLDQARTMELAGYTAYTYETQSALGGEIGHFAIEIGTDESIAVLDIGEVAVGDKSQEYEAEALEMLKTLKINKSL